ncbi:MAG: S9 family peptidase [Tepidisphaeraceae bacterium]
MKRFSAFLTVIGFAILAGAALGAEPTKLIPRAVLFGNPDKAQPRISPDGKWLAFVAPVDGVLNVWVAPTDSLSQAKPVTRDTKRGIRMYQWAFTSNHILYSQDEGGNENWNVHVVHLSTGQDRNLTPNSKVAARISQTSARFPEEIVVAINDRNPSFHDLHRMNIVTGKDTLLLENPGMIKDQPVAGFAIDNDLRVRMAQTASPGGGAEVFTLVTEPNNEGSGGAKWESFVTIPPEDGLTTRASEFDASGDVLYVTDSRDRNTAGLFAWNLKTGEKKLLAEDPKSDAGQLLRDPKTLEAQAVSFNYDRNRWKAIDPSVEPDLKALAGVCEGDISVTSRSLDDKTWTVAYAADNAPTKFYLYDRGTRQAKFLFTNRENWAGLPLVKMHPAVIKSRDGLDLVCYYSLPLSVDPDQDGKPEHPVPMVLDIHGGPWARDNWGLNPYFQWLANRGYAVMSVNYRGSTGFGKEFVNAANKQWGAKMHDDLLDVVDWAVKNGIAPKDKIAIMGASYGGYATLVGMTFTPDVFACGVDIVGPSNLVTLIRNAPPYWLASKSMWRTRVGDESSQDGQKFLESRSPLFFVDKINRPLLIGQGANDPRVKRSEADQIVKAMNDKNISVTYILFPDEGHGFARPQNNMAFNAVTEAFLAKHLGGQCEPVGDGFKGSSIQIENGADQVPGLESAKPASAVEKP